MQKIADKAQAMQAAATPTKSIQDLIRKMELEIKKALPAVITPERFTRVTLSALSSNPRLAECTPKSFLAAMMTSAQLGMEVNTPLGHCYLIPFENKKKGITEVQFQLGYQGLIALARRSGEVTEIDAQEVHENDLFNYQLGLHADIDHHPVLVNRGKVIAYYAYYKTKNGGFGFAVMSLDDVIQHRDKYSKAAEKGFSPWATNFDEMAKKTVLKKALKYAPISIEFARAISNDGTVKESISEDMYAEPAQEITAEFVDEPGENAE